MDVDGVHLLQIVNHFLDEQGAGDVPTEEDFWD